MKKVRLKRTIVGFWPIEKDYDNQLDILIIFFTCDVVSFADKFIEWAKDEESFNYESNETSIDREDGLINLMNDHDSTYTEVSMTKDAFIKMLEDWQKIYQAKPEIVIMKWDGKEVRFEVEKN